MIHEPVNIIEAVKELHTFFQEDIWYAKKNEWKTEGDMLRYINAHFEICFNQIKKIQKEELLSEVEESIEETKKLAEETKILFGL